MIVLYCVNTLNKGYDKEFFNDIEGIKISLQNDGNDIVISDNLPNGDEVKLDDFLGEINKDLLIAFDIKSALLAPLLKKIIKKHNLKNYFAFNMSLNDMDDYIEQDINVFSYASELSKEPMFDNDGVYLEALTEEWVTYTVIEKYLKQGNMVCIASNEMNNIGITKQWKTIKSMQDKDNIMLCTSKYHEAVKFFS